MTPHEPPGGYTGQSAINQNAADGGYWHQHKLIEALNNWRSNPLGARLGLALFGSDLLRARSAGARPMDDPSAKPDLLAWMVDERGTRQEALVSAKLAREGSTASPARPMHHAARVKFEDAEAHGLLPADDLESRSALLSHFLDGESLSRREPEVRERAMVHLRSSWARAAACAVQGHAEPHAGWVVVSIASESPDGTLALALTRALRAADAVAALSAEPPEASEPREEQVGTIGSRMMHIQRGQALSLGAQRDIQVKINAGALFELAPELPCLPGRSAVP